MRVDGWVGRITGQFDQSRTGREANANCSFIESAITAIGQTHNRRVLPFEDENTLIINPPLVEVATSMGLSNRK